MQTFAQRMIGAAKLKAATYEEVEHDGSATGQAALVVILAALAAGIGAMGGGSIELLLLVSLSALLGWIIWAVVIWAIGTKLLPEPQTEANVGQLLRTLGFAAAPGLLRVFGFVPLLGPLLLLVVYLWMLATTVVAVRQALDYQSTGRAIGVCLIGWLAQLLVLALLGGAAGIGMSGSPAPAI